MRGETVWLHAPMWNMTSGTAYASVRVSARTTVPRPRPTVISETRNCIRATPIDTRIQQTSLRDADSQWHIVTDWALG